MEKPITLEKHCEINGIDLIAAKKIISVNDTYKNYINYKLCNICEKEMDSEDFRCTEAYHFLNVCKKHSRYGSFFRLDMAKMAYRIDEGKETNEDIKYIKSAFKYMHISDDSINIIKSHIGLSNKSAKRIIDVVNGK